MKCMFCEREGQPGKLALFRIKGKGSVYDGGHVCDECLLKALEAREKEMQSEFERDFKQWAETVLLTDGEVDQERRIQHNALHGGECVECGRVVPVLNAGSLCEGCELDAIMEDAR